MILMLSLSKHEVAEVIRFIHCCRGIKNYAAGLQPAA
jgi:hypothetical protein